MVFALTSIVSEITSRPALCGSTRVVTIDGPAGSGKTTLAEALSKTLENCPIVSMDNVYNGWDLALTDETFERIIEQILRPVQDGTVAQYQKYDWAKKTFTTWIDIEPTSFLIIEGVGSGHPMLRPFVSLQIWVEADSGLLLNRVLKRDGTDIREEMLRWQKSEAEFFKQHKIRSSADFIFSTSK